MNKTKHKNTEANDALRNFDLLPDCAFVRLPTLIILFSVSQATIWRWVKAGDIPEPKKLSSRTTAWVVGEIKATLVLKRNRKN